MAHFRPMKSLNTVNHDNVPHSTPSDPQTDTNNNSQSYFFKEKIDNYNNSTDKRMNIDISVRSGLVHYSRPVVIFGAIDLSNLSPLPLYFILSLGLVIFMCLYGYYQELVAYNYFDRKLTMFSTFLHFLGCYIVAHGQRQSIHTSGSKSIGAVLTMGTAPYKLGAFYYLLLIFLKTVSQGLTNLSMTQINYPAKVLFKSASPIINMIIGLLWFRRSYLLRDYIVVLLLVLGLYVFINGDADASPEGTSYGIILVTVAMFCGAAVPMVQEFCINKYNATVEELLYHSFLGSTLISFILSILTGELKSGFFYIATLSSPVHVYSSLVLFSVVGFCGSNFSTGLTLRFGSLVNGITNTARKAVTLGLSFALFPSRNHLTRQHIVGAIIFFSGLIVRSIIKDGKGNSAIHTSTATVADIKENRDDIKDHGLTHDRTPVLNHDRTYINGHDQSQRPFVSNANGPMNLNSLAPSDVHVYDGWSIETGLPFESGVSDCDGSGSEGDNRKGGALANLAISLEEEDDMDVDMTILNSNNKVFRV